MLFVFVLVNVSPVSPPAAEVLRFARAHGLVVSRVYIFLSQTNRRAHSNSLHARVMFLLPWLGMVYCTRKEYIF